MNLVDRIKRFAKKSVVIPFFVGAALIAGCNTQQNTVPVCKNNPAIENAEEIGFTTEEAKIFEPLGLDCKIGTEYDDGTPYDKVTIEKFWELYSSEQINLENIKLIVNERMGKEVDRGEWSALNLTIEVYKKQKEKELIPQNAKLTLENYVTHLNEEEYAISIGKLDKEDSGGLSLSMILYQQEENMFGIPGLATPDSDLGCKTQTEHKMQGEDIVTYTYDNLGIPVINPFPYPIELKKVVTELRYDPEGSWSTFFEIIKPSDSKILQGIKFYGRGHTASYVNPDDGTHVGFTIDEKNRENNMYDPWYYDKQGNFHFPKKIFYTVGGLTNEWSDKWSYDIDFNYYTDSPENISYVFYNPPLGRISVVEKRLPKSVNPLNVLPDRPGGINTFDYEVPIYDFTGEKVIAIDMSKVMSEGTNTPEEIRFKITCKYYTNPPNTQNNSTGYDSFNYNYY